MGFPELLRKLREKAGLSQSGLAKKAGLREKAARDAHHDHLMAVKNSLRAIRASCEEAIDRAEVIKTDPAKQFIRSIAWNLAGIEGHINAALGMPPAEATAPQPQPQPPPRFESSPTSSVSWKSEPMTMRGDEIQQLGQTKPE